MSTFLLLATFLLAVIIAAFPLSPVLLGLGAVVGTILVAARLRRGRSAGAVVAAGALYLAVAVAAVRILLG